MTGAEVEPTAADAEFFPTPAWVVDRLVESIHTTAGTPFRWGDRWIDPCVGDGALPDAVDQHAYGLDWETWDIRDTGAAQHVGDWLAYPAPIGPERYAGCIMNPPFTKALQFADKALQCCNVVIMLQRLGWLASDMRREWVHNNRPATFVLPNRPDFDGRGGDSHDYAWYVWGLGHCEVDVLSTTPLHTRQAQKPTTPRRLPQTALDFGSVA